MLRILLCHAHQDSPAALALAASLEVLAESHVSLASTDGDAPDVLHLWDVEDSDAVLLLLAPECVPAQSSRASWEPLLDQLQRRARPDIGAVVLRPCSYPPLLERTSFFRQGLDNRHLRDLAAWLLNLHPEPGWPEWSILHPARLLPGTGPAGDLTPLWGWLADRAGALAIPTPDAPATAQAFAREAAAQFRATLWLDALQRPAECLAGELAAALGIRAEGSVEDAWCQIAAVLAAHRLLLVLDGWEGALPWPDNANGRSSILSLAPRSLPAADRDPGSPLWSAALACRESAFPLAFAARIAGLDFDQALPEARRLCQEGWLAELDPGTRRYRRLAAGTADDATRLRHAEALNAILLDRGSGATLAALCAAELEAAFDLAASTDWSLAVRLASRAHLFFEQYERRLEAVYLLRRAIQAAVVRGDEENAQHFRKKLAWLTNESGEVHHRWQEGEQGTLFG